jgi:hypothetical protein
MKRFLLLASLTTAAVGATIAFQASAPVNDPPFTQLSPCEPLYVPAKVQFRRWTDIPELPDGTPWQMNCAPVPFDAPVVKCGAENNGTWPWRWCKAGPSRRECVDVERNEEAAYGRACQAREGEVLYTTMPFYASEPEE